MPVAIRIRVGCQSGHRGDAQNYHSPDLSTASRHAPQQRSCSAAAAISAAAWGEAAVARPASRLPMLTAGHSRLFWQNFARRLASCAALVFTCARPAIYPL